MAKMSLINSLKEGDWQTPEYSSYFCRMSKGKGKVIQFILIPIFSARPLWILHVINSLLIPTMFYYLDVALFVKKKKIKKIKVASFPFTLLPFSSPSSVQKINHNTLLDTSKYTCSSFTRRPNLPIFFEYHWWTMSVLLSSKISRFLPGKATIHTKNTAHISQKIGILRHLCIQLYFQLIGTPAFSTTTNIVLPG